MMDAINYVYFIIIIIFGFPTATTHHDPTDKHKKSKINSLWCSNDSKKKNNNNNSYWLK